MPLLHCSKCHHEWEGDDETCSWCNAPGYIIEEETPFEKFCKHWFNGGMEEYMAKHYPPKRKK